MIMESSSAVYAVLSKELGPKAVKSLVNIKSACDLIISSRGVMNYSRVARVATECFGGPKQQSVLNNKNLKRYIDTRIYEYSQSKRPYQLSSTRKKDDLEPKVYPIDNLDSRTKTYIDQLHTRLELAENRYRELRKWQEEYTKANPVNLAEAIGRGPTDVGAMQLEYKSDNSELINQVREAVGALLNISEFISTLVIETKGEKKRLTLKRPAGDHVVLTPKQFSALDSFLEEQPDG